MKTRLPSFRGIEAFIHAAETLSFRVAAERMGVTVSAVSHRIHGLEEEVGLQLFDRSGSKVRLTTAGRSYSDRVRPMLSNLLRATEELHAEMDSPILRIASFQLFEAQWLVPRIGNFIEAFPDVELELVTLRRRHSIHADLTIRIVRSAEVGSEDEKLFELDSVPICRPDVAKSLSLRTPADLLRARLIKMSTALDAWPTWLKSAGVDDENIQPPIIVDSPTLSHELVMNGVGVGLSSSIFSDHLEKTGLVHPFAVRSIWYGHVYVNRASQHERPIVRAFRSWMRDMLASS